MGCVLLTVDANRGPMESHLIGWSDHKFLRGPIMVGSLPPPQAYDFFSERF